MASRFEILQNLLGEQDVYEGEFPGFASYEPAAKRGWGREADAGVSDDDEKILKQSYTNLGEFPQPLGRARRRSFYPIPLIEF